MKKRAMVPASELDEEGLGQTRSKSDKVGTGCLRR